MRIYFAAPLFNEAECRFNEDVCRQLEEAGHSVFLPQRDGFEGIDSVFEQEGIENQKDASMKIYDTDREEVLGADLVIAVLDGAVTDPGVAVEVAIAKEHDIPVTALLTDVRPFSEDEPINALVFGCLDRTVESSSKLVATLGESVE
jgi:nucleoside 2-deoxyribosyltransferase